MASIVKVPTKEEVDYDFIAFSFNGLHSVEDFGIYRTSDGDRYNSELSPRITDRTMEIAGADGSLFFGTNHKPKVFNINFAFEELDDVKLRELKKWFNGKEMHDLWFAEEPYKVYSAKVTGQPSFKFVSFDKYNNSTNKVDRVYKGEGTVQFTAYWPYAHTPDKIQRWNGTSWVDVGSGIIPTSYRYFQNYESFKANLPGDSSSSNQYGDLPFHFVAKLYAPGSGALQKIYKIKQNGVEIFSITVKFPSGAAYTDIQWDSKTGLVTAKKDSLDRVPLEYTGNALGTIEPGLYVTEGIYEMDHHYWYY